MLITKLSKHLLHIIQEGVHQPVKLRKPIQMSQNLFRLLHILAICQLIG